MKRKTEKIARNVKAKKKTDIKLKIRVGEEPEPSTSRIVAKKTSQEESESDYDCEVIDDIEKCCVCIWFKLKELLNMFI